MTALPMLAIGLSLLVQVGGVPQVEYLTGLDKPAAVRAITADVPRARAALDTLMAKVDASVHSDRQRPEQRRVQFDEVSLALGVRLSGLLAEATGDRSYVRRFEARQKRLAGTELLNERRYRDAITALDEALTEAQALGDEWLQAITRVNIAYGNLELGRSNESLRQSEQAAEIARGLDDRARALTLYNLASVHLHVRNFTRSIEYSQQAIAASQKAEIKLWEGNSLLNLGAAQQGIGQIQAARHSFEGALAVLENTRDSIGKGRALFNLGVLAAEQERNAVAAGYLERALPIIRSADVRHSHDIELDPKLYRNPVEISALQLLIDLYERTDRDDKKAEHQAALRTASARLVDPAAHTQKAP